ncbi:MAG: helix-hairpin-helix domain-containing protein [Bacteroidota bacterium]
MSDTPFLEYFTNLESQEGQFLWLCILVSFLLGFFIALLLRGGKIRRLKRELAASEKQRSDLQTLHTSTEEQLKARNLELQEESRERVALMDRQVVLENEKQQYAASYEELQRKASTLEASNRSYVSLVDTLNTEISDLKTNGSEAATNEGLGVVNNPASDPGETAASASEMAALQARLNQFESRLSALSAENQSLKTDLEAVKNTAQPAPVTETETDSSSSTSTTEQVTIQSDKTVLYDKIIVPDREVDDLTKIEGLGDFLAGKLNAAGIFTFEQIARWTPEQIELITQEIGYISGRIAKDDWVGQAARLTQGQQPAAYAAVATPEPEKKAKNTKSPKETDLKMIEGIGPKIEEVLHQAGIPDWKSLASTEPGRLREILEAAGGRFRMHNPYTWPLQARLAAAGRWDELKEYQDELKGGRE